MGKKKAFMEGYSMGATKGTEIGQEVSNAFLHDFEVCVAFISQYSVLVNKQSKW